MTSVLVIDDSAEICSLFCQMLRSFGYDAREAENGVHGLRSYQAAPADVVLLDIFMPEKDGLETLRDLLHFDPNARVIAMTGGGRYKNTDILKLAQPLGAKKLLLKPIKEDDLRTAIKEVLAAPPG